MILFSAALMSLSATSLAQAACTAAFTVNQGSSNNTYNFTLQNYQDCDPENYGLTDQNSTTNVTITTSQGGSLQIRSDLHGINYMGLGQDDGFVYTPPSAGFTGTDTATFYGYSGSQTVAGNPPFSLVPGAVTITVQSTTPVPVVSSFTASAVGYNSGSASASSFSASSHATNSPTSYAVGSATTANGGSVSISSAGLVSYTPPTGFRGNDSFTFTATNAGGPSTPAATVTVPVGNPTFSVTLPAATGTVGVAYNSGAAAVVASGGKSPYSNFSATGLPAGLTMNSSGVISGTPTTATSATVVVTLTDSSTGTGAYTSTASASLTISNPPVPVTSSFTASAVGYNAGAASASSFSVSGHATNSPTSYAVGSATTANGGSVSVDSAGLVSYTPPTGFRGNDSFTFTATNAGGPSTPAATVTVPVGNPTFAVTLPAATGTVGVAYNSGAAAVTVSGGKAPYSTFSATGLPAGLTMNSSGVISGTPTAVTSATVVVTVTDSSTGTGAYTSTASASLTTSAATVTLPTTSLTAGATGTAYNATLNAATGGTGPYSYAVTAGALPAGMSLGGGTHALTGAPTAAGTFNFTVTATDSSTGTGAPFAGSQTYSLTIGAPTITLATASLTNAVSATAYSANLPTASGGVAPYAYSLVGGALPTGVTLSSSGALSGTPTQGGTFNFTARATDSSTGSGPFHGDQSYSLTVDAATITVSPTTLSNGTVAAAYSATLSGGGGVAPYSFAPSGSVPPGLSLSAGGVLSGTPTASGSFTFTATATDSSGGAGPYSGGRTYTVTIAAPTLSVSPSSLGAGTVAAAFSQTLSASNGTAPYAWAVTSGALPGGLSLNASTGVLSGTPTQGGTFNFTIRATDSTTGGGPYTASQAYTFTVAAPTVVLPTTSLTSGAAGASYSASLNAASGGTAPYSYSVTSGALPAGISLNSAGALSGTPTAVGTFSFTVTVTDSSTGAGPYTAGQTYSLTIGAPGLTLPATTLSNASAASAYSATLNPASGGVGPYTYGVTAGALPAGVSLSSAGALSGTPTATGVFNFTVTATDSSTGTGSPFSASRSFSLTVSAATLTVTPASLPNATQGVSYSQTVSASGGVAPYSFAVTSGALPAGVSLASGGALSGAPTVNGTFPVTITATDSASGTPNSQAKIYSLVVNVPAPPVAGATSANVAANSSANPITLVLSGGTATGVAVVSAATHGAAVASGLAITYTPTGGYSGPDSFTYTAANAGGTSAPATVTITVGAPTLTVTGAPAAGTVAVAYSATFSASTGTAPYSFTATTPPPGLTLSTAGVLSGSPTAAGTFSTQVSATDAHGATGTQTFSITIAAPTVAISSPSAGALPAATAQVTYSQAFAATGGVAPHSFAVTAGALPPGLSLSSAGVLSGAPTGVGTYNFSITPSDGSTAPGPYAGTASAYSLVVSAPTLALGPTSLPTVPWGVAYTQTFTATGGAAPYTFHLAGALPTGMTFDTATGVLSGAPTQDGAFPITVSVTDSTTGAGAPFSVSHNLTLTVAAPVPPTAAPTSVSTGYEDATTIDVSSMINGFYDTVVIVTPPSHGTAVVQTGSGLRTAGLHTAAASPHITIVYTPNPGFYGADSFTYAASGPGGSSAPAQIALAVAIPAPVVVDDTATTAANTATTIAVTANDTGPLATIALASAPSHGTAVISGLNVIYTPATDFFGTDAFTYTATGTGGTSTPATVTVTVTPLAVPTAPAKVLTVLAGKTAILAATTDATGGPFTAVTVATAPTRGTAVVSGQTIVYTPNVSYSGGDAFTYTLTNTYGASLPIPVTVTVNPAPLTAPPITVNIVSGQTAVVDLTSTAHGGPFTAAAVAAISPTTAGAATITTAAAGAYSLSFKPNNDFVGSAVISYTLSNAFATSPPGLVTVIVKARPDPSADPEVRGLIAAQGAAARRFANGQINNFNRRLEQLHNGGGGGGRYGVSFQGGQVERPDGLEARERFRQYAQLGQDDDPIDRLSLLPSETRARNAGGGSEGPGGSGGSGGSSGGGKPSRWGVWVAGAADFGMRDTIGDQSGFRFTTDGLTAGVDYRVNSQLAIGAGLGYGHDSSRIGHNGTKSQAESYSGGVYASYQPSEQVFVDGVAGYGTLNFKSRRYVTDTAALLYGDRDGDQLFAALTAGLEHHDGAFMISPYGRLGVTRSKLDAFTERDGGVSGLTFQSQIVRTFTGTLGLRGDYSYKVSFGQVAPRFRVEYTRDFESPGSAGVNYADWIDGPTYQLVVDPVDRDQTRMELGVDLQVDGGPRIAIDFNNTLSRNSDSQGMRLSVQAPF